VTIRSIHLLGSPVLRQRADEVTGVDAEVRTLVEDLLDTMRADKGVGLAANQVGLARRVAVVDTNDGQPAVALINPVILEQSGKAVQEEGCLSIPDIYGNVERALHIVFETTGLDGKRVRLEASELRARAIQHEIDHLDGILFIDHLSPLKRKLLLNKWNRSRKGKTGFLKEVSAAAVED